MPFGAVLKTFILIYKLLWLLFGQLLEDFGQLLEDFGLLYISTCGHTGHKPQSSFIAFSADLSSLNS